MQAVWVLQWRYLTGRGLHLPTTFGPSDPDRALREWLATPLGQQLLAGEAQLLSRVLDGVFGLELLQVGAWGASRALLASSRTQRQTLITQSAACPAGAVIARYDALPVQTASVDAVLLPHTLEFDPDPQALVREADRVLTGEGQLIILGFRPASLWGLRARAARGGYPPDLKQLLGERRLRDWLSLLGYQLLPTRHYLYCRPWQAGAPDCTRRILRRGLFNLLPPGAYLIHARKQVYRPRLPRSRFATLLRKRRRVLAGVAQPTTREVP